MNSKIGIEAFERLQQADGSVPRPGSCKKCGRVGHLTYECLNDIKLPPPPPPKKTIYDHAIKPSSDNNIAESKRNSERKEKSKKKKSKSDKKKDRKKSRRRRSPSTSSSSSGEDRRRRPNKRTPSPEHHPRSSREIRPQKETFRERSSSPILRRTERSYRADKDSSSLRPNRYEDTNEAKCPSRSHINPERLRMMQSNRYKKP